jgi:predicted Zn-dependent protease
MGSERLARARERENGIYRSSNSASLNRERYMDHTASLRVKKKGISLLQEGEAYIAKKEYDTAEKTILNALKILKDDYTAHVVMAHCQMLRENPAQALTYADLAKKLYPSQMQGYYMAGLANIETKKYADAYIDFYNCDKLLPGNPQVTFFKGLSMDRRGERQPAAENYIAYLKMIHYQPNKYSTYAYERLKEWGYAR